MAYTVVRNMTVFGDQRVAILDVTADGAEANLSTGLAYVNGFSIGVQSMTTTTVPKMALNKNSSGTASNGTIGMSAVVSGDHFTLVVYGR